MKPSHLANTIRLKRSQHSGPFIIVEGRDDRLFLEPMTSESVKIEVADGRANVVDTIKILNADNFKGAVGLIDLDLDLATDTPVSLPENVVSHGFADIECLMFHSPTAIAKVLTEFGSRPKLEVFPKATESVANAAASITGLRLLSHQDGLGLRFQGLKYRRFTDANDLNVRHADLVDEVLNRTHTQKPVDRVALVDDLDSAAKRVRSLTTRCCGDDLLEILAIGLTSCLGNEQRAKAMPDVLRRALRLAYSAEEFRKTQLYADLLGWQAGTDGMQVVGDA